MADSRDLVSLNTLRAYINPALGHTDDFLLTKLITATSVWAARYTGREFAAQSYIETRNGQSRSAMRLYHWPVISVSTVQIDGATLNPAPANQPLSGGGYVFDEQFVYLREGLGFPTIFRSGFYRPMRVDGQGREFEAEP